MSKLAPWFRSLLDGFALVEQVTGPIRPAKHVMLLVGLCLMMLMDAPQTLLLFSPAFFLLDHIYGAHVRRVTALGNEAARANVLLLAVHHAANVASFALLALAVARLPWVPAAVVAHVILAAQAFYILAFDSRSREVFLIGVAVLAVFAQAVLYHSVTIDASMTVLICLHGTILTVTVIATIAGLQANKTHQQLEEVTARLAAAQKGETVGRLTSGIAHDFRNLLTVMGGNLDLMAEMPAGEHPRLLREVREAAHRGERLTARLLSTARTNQRAEDTGPVDLDAFLGCFVAFAERVIPANVALQLGQVDRGLTLRADTAELEAALLNLVLNARDAMTEGGVITIDARQSGDTPPRAILTVRDDGPGMSADLAARAAEPFVTTKGTGLGLAMVRAFASDTGGSLSIESAPGDGTKIQLNLPI